MSSSLTISPTNLSAIRLFSEGTARQNAAHAEKEKDKVGTLRGGSSGALVNGNVIGTCHRKSLARFLGFQEPKDADSYNFFDAGYANEWLWESKLRESWTGQIRCEEEIPVSWVVPDTEVKVTGRPDVVLFDQDQPVLGLELKAILATNSAAGVVAENKPKVDHVVQAAHYSWKLGVPWILVYTVNVKGQPSYPTQKRLGIREITPGKREFKLGWDEGSLYYTDSDDRRTDTIVTTTSIEDYYRLIVDMAEKKTLFRDYSNLDLDGSLMGWSHETYCVFCRLANKSRDYQEWLDRVQMLSEEGE